MEDYYLLPINMVINPQRFRNNLAIEQGQQQIVTNRSPHFEMEEGILVVSQKSKRDPAFDLLSDFKAASALLKYINIHINE